jgi:modulator of FtsH protease HflC
MNNVIKKTMKWTAGVLAAMTLYSIPYTVHQTQQAVITRLGKPVSVIINPVEPARNETGQKYQIEQIKKEIAEYSAREGIPAPTVRSGAGLKFKLPFIETVHYFDRRLLEWDGYPEEITTKDKKFLYVDATGRYYITNPLIFINSVGGSEERASGTLDEIIDSEVRKQISNRDSIESVRSTNRKMEVTDKELEETTKVDRIAEGREKITRMITTQVHPQSQRYGMSVIDLQIKRLVYVDAVKVNVENRMIAERNRMKEKYLSEGDGEYAKIMGDKDKELQRIKSEAYMAAEKIKGTADAAAIKTYADAYSQDPDFYRFTKSLEVLKGNAKGATFVLDKNNELFRHISK